MSIVKQERHERELAVFAARTDAGAQAIRLWLYHRRDEVNAAWPTASGDELLQLQGEAKHIARQIRLIEQGPTIKQPEGSST
jgi:hypothetical protein